MIGDFQGFYKGIILGISLHRVISYWPVNRGDRIYDIRDTDRQASL